MPSSSILVIPKHLPIILHRLHAITNFINKPKLSICEAQVMVLFWEESLLLPYLFEVKMKITCSGTTLPRPPRFSLHLTVAKRHILPSPRSNLHTAVAKLPQPLTINTRKTTWSPPKSPSSSLRSPASSAVLVCKILHYLQFTSI